MGCLLDFDALYALASLRKTAAVRVETTQITNKRSGKPVTVYGHFTYGTNPETTAYIGVDDHCYVVYVPDEQGEDAHYHPVTHLWDDCVREIKALPDDPDEWYRQATEAAEDGDGTQTKQAGDAAAQRFMALTPEQKARMMPAVFAGFDENGVWNPDAAAEAIDPGFWDFEGKAMARSLRNAVGEFGAGTGGDPLSTPVGQAIRDHMMRGGLSNMLFEGQDPGVFDSLRQGGWQAAAPLAGGLLAAGGGFLSGNPMAGFLGLLGAGYGAQRMNQARQRLTDPQNLRYLGAQTPQGDVAAADRFNANKQRALQQMRQDYHTVAPLMHLRNQFTEPFQPGNPSGAGAPGTPTQAGSAPIQPPTTTPQSAPSQGAATTPKPPSKTGVDASSRGHRTPAPAWGEGRCEVDLLPRSAPALKLAFSHRVSPRDRLAQTLNAEFSIHRAQQEILGDETIDTGTKARLLNTFNVAEKVERSPLMTVGRMVTTLGPVLGARQGFTLGAIAATKPEAKRRLGGLGTILQGARRLGLLDL